MEHGRAVDEHRTPSRLRRQQWNTPHHAHELTFSTYRRRQWLSDSAAAHAFLQALDVARSKHDFDVFAYVVMPAHCHVLVCPKSPAYDMGEILKAIKSPAAKAIFGEFPQLRQLCRIERTGRKPEYRFWQPGGGYDRNIFKSKTAWQVIEYFHANPVRSGLCKRPTDWPWSSAAVYEGLSTPVPVDICRWTRELGSPHKLERF